ncbi:hypothetical protein LOTGIDRAFT_232722, partial [Lottia gigantea]
MLKFTIFTLVCCATAIIAEGRGCKPVKGVWGCAYMPNCFGDSMCGEGQKCCPHPCGDHCQLIVNCDKINCHLTCQYGFERDAKGCDVCKCRTTKKCVGFFCSLDLLKGNN